MKLKTTRTKIGKSRNVVGLMSGTSADGVDAALVRISGSRDAVRVKPLAFSSLPYPRGLQQRIVSAAVGGSVAEICHLNAVLGEWFSRAALRVITQSGLSASQVHLIGSHGQTMHHLPTPVREYGMGPIRSTLQVAEPSIIAERTGITTVANFRPRDMAVGGEGAPLAPYAHYILLGNPHRSRLIVNLGGIGNVTYLPAGTALTAVRAFDTGPGNMVLDALMHHLSDGRLSMDRNGRLASKGTVDLTLLKTMLAHPFLKKRPPKSTGREEFGDAFIARILKHTHRSMRREDLLATASRFTAVSVGLARQWLPGHVEEVVVAGGGAHNRKVMADLAAVFDPTPVKRLDDLGWDSRAFEAIAFALFAYQTMNGVCTNVPSVTGASHPVVLGQITPGQAAWTRS
jgi:anhydro-N-acetylmuramic acid kinase